MLHRVSVIVKIKRKLKRGGEGLKMYCIEDEINANMRIWFEVYGKRWFVFMRLSKRERKGDGKRRMYTMKGGEYEGAMWEKGV